MQWATIETETEKTPDILSILNHPKNPFLALERERAKRAAPSMLWPLKVTLTLSFDSFFVMFCVNFFPKKLCWPLHVVFVPLLF